MQKSFSFLRDEATNAHFGGDGLKINHIASIALNSIREKARDASNFKRIEFSDLRWAYFYSIYWAIDDWIKHEIEASLELHEIKARDKNDVALINFLLPKLLRTSGPADHTPLLEFEQNWFAKRSNEPFDVAAISLAIELQWFQDPTSDSWDELATNWKAKSKAKSPLEKTITALIERLSVQNSFYTGDLKSVLSYAKDEKPSWLQAKLLRAWYLFFECETRRLQEAIDDLIKSGFSVDSPNYSSFWTLLHFSRVERESPENQIVSLNRFAHLEVLQREPVRQAQLIRDKKFHAAYSKLAMAGFQDSDASERLDCLRIAMLTQLHALRRWDIGEWIGGERDKAKILLELGAKGDLGSAKEGLLSAVRGFWIPKKNKFPHLDICLQFLDMLSQSQRVEFVEQLLSQSPKSWFDAIRIFRELSDAIPEECTQSLAEWTVKCDELQSRFIFSGESCLLIWLDLFPLVDNLDTIVPILKSSILKKAADPIGWSLLGELLYVWIVTTDESTAIETARAIMDAADARPHEEKARFNIIYNSVKNRLDLVDICEPWLKKRVENNSDLVQRFLVENLPEIGKRKIGDRKFLEGIKAKLIEYCQRQLNLNEKNIPIGSENFHHYFQYVKLTKTESELVSRLIDVVNAEAVPYVNKVEPLACLAHLVEYGPKNQAKSIFDAAKKWLERIEGRELIPAGGPLSNIQVTGLSAGSINQVFLMLIDSFSYRIPEYSKAILFKWIIKTGTSIPFAEAGQAIRICLRLSRSMASTESEESTSLVAMAAAIAQSAFTSNPQGVIHGFGTVLFPETTIGTADESDVLNQSEFCYQIFLQFLQKGARIANHNVRRSVAVYVARWSDTNDLFETEIEALKETLMKDSRIRVRKPFLQ